jgi:hypothetical protein
MIFIHIPKTAGTSFIVEMGNLFGDTNCKRITNQNEKIESQATDSFSNVFGKFIAGHFPVSRWNGISGNYFTFLRNPIDRVESLYRFYKSLPYSLLVDFNLEKEFTFSDFINSNNAGLYFQISNGMSRQLSGYHQANYQDCEEFFNPDFESQWYSGALTFLHNNAFGISERMTDSLELLKNEMQLDFMLDSISQNVTPKHIEYLSEDDRGLILEKNRYDLKLYECAKEIFEERLISKKQMFFKKAEPFKNICLPVSGSTSYEIADIAWRQGFYEAEREGIAWLRHDVPSRIYIASNEKPFKSIIRIQFYSLIPRFEKEDMTVLFNGVLKNFNLLKTDNSKIFQIQFEITISEILELNELSISQHEAYSLKELGIKSSDKRLLRFALFNMSLESQAN